MLRNFGNYPNLQTHFPLVFFMISDDLTDIHFPGAGWTPSDTLQHLGDTLQGIGASASCEGLPPIPEPWFDDPGAPGRQFAVRLAWHQTLT